MSDVVVTYQTSVLRSHFKQFISGDIRLETENAIQRMK